MLIRTITSSILIIIVAITIYIFPVWMFSTIASIFIGWGLYEFFKLDSKNIFPKGFVYIGIFSGILLPHITYFYRPTGGLWEALFFIVVLISLFITQFTRKENHNAVALIALTLFGVFYVGWFFTFLVKIRFLEDGHNLVAYLLTVTKSGDIGAYLIGSRFGRHYLIPRISPKKTVEGAIGGFLFSVASGFISWLFFGLNWIPFWAILASSIIIGVFAQLGDLSESLLKRDYQVKDSGFYLPGLGGILDVIDSILFTAPIFYIFLTLIVEQ